jgi:hypothetical protein
VEQASPNFALRGFSEVGMGLPRGASCPCWANTDPEAHGEQGGTHRGRGPPPTNNGVPEEPPARQDVDVLLDVSELEVDKIHLKVRNLRAHVSVLAELASLVNLQIGVDARLDLVELEIEGVRAKVLLKVRLDNVRAILVHALDTVAEHPEILETLTRALDELLTGTLGNAVGALENVLGDLEVGGTVDEALRGSLEEVRDTLQEILSQAGGQAGEGGGTGPALPGGPSSSAAGEPPSGATPQEEG